MSAYVDQLPKSDLSRERAKEFGFTIYPTIAEALRCGGDKLAVDAVLDHRRARQLPGQRARPEDSTRATSSSSRSSTSSEKDGRVVPVFNDKHLSWKWEWAKEMVDTARKLKFPFLAGSSLPVTWRMPAIDMPYGAEVEEMLCVAIGGVDSYDFHALEVIQCMAERRKGGETGVRRRAGAARRRGLEAAMVWQRAAGTRDCSRRACAASRRSAQAETYQPSLSDRGADARRGSRNRSLIASSTPTA